MSEVHMKPSSSNEIRCVILAAGTASRLHPLTKSCPKCLLEVQGKTILERTIENVLQANIQSIAIVVGFQAGMIRSYLMEKFPEQKFRFILNPNYSRTNNAYSLLLARRFMEDAEHKIHHRLLLLDSDIVFSSRLLPELLSHTSLDATAIRVAGTHNLEEIGVRIDGEQMVTFIGKNVPISESFGESIGIEYFSAETAGKIFSTLEKRIRSGQGRTEYYEATFQDIIDQGLKLKALDMSAFASIEIDTIEDLQRAQELLPE